MIRAAKADGLPVTAETCPHYLALTDEAVLDYRTHAKMNPPLKARRDQEALIAALADGTIDAIATDHAPHAAQEKEQEFDLAPFGVIGLETAFSIGYELVRRSQLSRSRLIETLTTGPAKILQRPIGTLAPGSLADLVMIDPDESWPVDPRQFQSKGRNTPFEGWTLHGCVLLTLVEGRVAHQVAAAEGART
jgi:dihydroorotase